MAVIRILHLEDDYRDRELVQFALRAGGIEHDIQYAISRDEFLTRLDTNEFDLVIADFKLPAFDGAEALRLVRERSEELPFILLSGTLGEERAVEILRRGATDFVLKENMRRLVPIIQRAVQELRQRRERQQAVQALQESERRFRIIAEQTGQLIYDYDLTHGTIRWSGAVTAVTGYTPEEYAAFGYAAWERFIHPDDLPGVQTMLDTAIEHKSFFHAHYRYKCRDGSYIHVEDRGAFMDGDSGVHMVGTLSDVTRRIAAKEALQKSEQKYRTVIEFMNEGLIQVDNDDIILFANESFCRMFGFGQDELVGQIAHRLILFEEDWPALLYRNHMRTLGQAERYEIRTRKKSGELMWMEISGAPVYDASGAVIGSIGIFTDVTRRQQSEQQLRKLSRAVEQSPASIVITDLEGTIEYVNQRFTEVTGYSPEEAVGRNPRFLQGGHTTRDEYHAMWATILAGGEWHGEFHTRKKNGEKCWESASISPITDADGNITHFIAVKEDITERKRFEEELINAKLLAEQSEKLKDAFIANVSHEIRTPLNVILGYIRLLASDYRAVIMDEDVDFLDSIDKAGQRLMRTVEHILSISTLQTRAITVNRQEIDVNDRLGYLIAEFIPSATRKGLDLSYESTAANAVILADPDYFDQAIVNLLDNALKFTSVGGASVVVASDGDDVTIRISDTGIGMSDEYLPDLFKVFSQESIGYSRPYEGLGLGLALVHRYVELNGGSILVESTKGQGTTFTLRFFMIGHRDGAVAATMPPHRLAAAVASSEGQRRKILLVEDDEQNQQLLRVLFSHEFTLCIAPDAAGALECLRSQEIDLVLMDLSLAGEMDGIELTRMLRSDPAFSDLPIIALTAHAFPRDRQNCLDAGCNDYVAKPFQRDTLRELIHSHIRRR